MGKPRKPMASQSEFAERVRTCFDRMLNINKAAIAILSDMALHSTPGELNIARLAVELGVEVAHDEGRDRGQIQGDERVDRGARTTRETIQPPPRGEA